MGSTESPGIKGIELSKPASTTALGSMRSQGVSFAIVRGYRSTSTVDPNLAANVANAWAAGMAHVDVYHTPSFSSGNPARQVNALVNYLKVNNVKYGQMWLNIEGPGAYWGDDTAANADFIAELFNEMRSNGVHLGIRTSASQWEPIAGSWTGGSAYPLWYKQTDSKQTFDDFTPFGGWTKPNIKTYDEGELAGVGVERLWYLRPQQIPRIAPPTRSRHGRTATADRGRPPGG
ncbi:GH25 family lysozyme [Kitasatospora sp. NPDC059327]|uniref:GH25 family lysozyme n=1 Tax=Kitasatospora sp. NPDC059327 TaxID=3346803 RepID=UPI0036C08614